METIQSPTELQSRICQARQAGQSIGLVPTMGYFHQGHLSLMARARQENDLVVVSLFVNPIQFGPQEDLRRYPRNLQRDQELAAGVGVDLLFTPEVETIYPAGFQTLVEVTELSKGLCGRSRPTHFQGVATVVLKLFNLVAPDRAYFGAKDAQQLRVIQRMVQDLNLPLTIVPCPIVREADGLAMSSRNIYLNSTERQAALVLYQTLTEAQRLLVAGERSVAALRRKLRRIVAAEPLVFLDYLAIVASDTLKPLVRLEGEVLVALAVKLGNTRLIDNLCIKIND